MRQIVKIAFVNMVRKMHLHSFDKPDLSTKYKLTTFESFLIQRLSR